MSLWKRALAPPWRDLNDFMETAVERGVGGLAAAALGLTAGWWLYVPIHEFLHAAACWASGGEVTRLEIARLYGGDLWARLAPSWVVAGGEYAGRLSGFSVGGSDWRYLATDLGPYLLTLFPGVWAVREGVRRGRTLLAGMALPAAFAPWLGLGGDAYEIGSLLVGNLPPWSADALAQRLRGDDIVRVADGLAGAGAIAWTGFVLSAVAGLAWAGGTYALADAVARGLRRLDATRMTDRKRRERGAGPNWTSRRPDDGAPTGN